MSWNHKLHVMAVQMHMERVRGIGICAVLHDNIMPFIALTLLPSELLKYCGEGWRRQDGIFCLLSQALQAFRDQMMVDPLPLLRESGLKDLLDQKEVLFVLVTEVSTLKHAHASCQSNLFGSRSARQIPQHL